MTHAASVFQGKTRSDADADAGSGNGKGDKVARGERKSVCCTSDLMYDTVVYESHGTNSESLVDEGNGGATMRRFSRGCFILAVSIGSFVSFVRHVDGRKTAEPVLTLGF